MIKTYSILYTRPFGWGFSGSNGKTRGNVSLISDSAEHAGESFLSLFKGQGYEIEAIDEILV